MMSTQKYNVSTEKWSAVVTYTAGRFRKIELKKGRFDSEEQNRLGHIFPASEEALQRLVNKSSLIKYEPLSVTKNSQFFSFYVTSWFNHYSRINGVAPKFDGADGRNLKQIIKYLEEITSSPEEARNTWDAILSNWQKLDDFFQKNMDIKFINSQLNKIITNLKYVTSQSRKGHNANGLRQEL